MEKLKLISNNNDDKDNDNNDDNKKSLPPKVHGLDSDVERENHSQLH